jgi:hypothetical protein
MDTFDGLFLEEISSSVTSSEAGTELDRIFRPLTPYILKVEDIYFDENDVFNKQEEQKRKENNKGKSGVDLEEDHEDDKKINGNNNKQHIIPIKEYAKPFKEELKTTNFKSFRLAPTQLHQKGFKEDSIEWLRTRKRVSSQNIRKQGKVYKSSDNSSQPVGRHKVRYANEKAPP